MSARASTTTSGRCSAAASASPTGAPRASRRTRRSTSASRRRSATRSSSGSTARISRASPAAPKESFEPLAVDDEEDEPFILRCRNGKGQVLLMNWWGYPAAANMDVGCGAEIADVGMVGYLYRYAAKLGRGNVYVTGGDFENPDDECSWVVCSYFPDEGKVYLLNLDYEQSHKFVLHHFGEKDFVTLAPAEFRILDSVKLDPDEKLNEK